MWIVDHATGVFHEQRYHQVERNGLRVIFAHPIRFSVTLSCPRGIRLGLTVLFLTATKVKEMNMEKTMVVLLP